MEITEIQSLLEKVCDRIKTCEEEENKLKSSFNFFKILKIDRKEIYHSKFIAELLNPKGLHGLGNTFLEIFLDVLPRHASKQLSMDNCKVETEFHMGDIPEDWSKGGFIDIILFKNKHAILIENKIYAPDQKYQLLRYKDESINYKNCIVLYLTLDGRCPSVNSIKNDILKLEENVDFYCISYKNEITYWLKECIKKAANHSTIKETIKGYLTVIQFLTHQTSYHDMQKEIKTMLLENNNHLKAAREISETLDIMKNETNAKMEKIHFLLDVENLSSIINSKLEKSDCNSDGGYNIFFIKINGKLEITVCTDDDLLCYAYAENQDENGFTTVEEKGTFTAEEFVKSLNKEIVRCYKNT
jgi:hypothetical protein